MCLASSKCPHPLELHSKHSGKKIRENADYLKNLVFSENETSRTVIKTKDFRFDVHKDSKNPLRATGIIQGNSEAGDKAVQKFTKGESKGHKGTHQIIGEKIRFGLGEEFKVEEVAAVVENTE